MTAASRAARLEYCLDRIVHDEDADVLRFMGMRDGVFVDEKWFFIDLICRRYILLPHEPVPQPTTRHKNHIIKVMFLSAVGRPRRDTYRNRHFDGKLGIWPFVVEKVAARSSSSRRRWTESPIPRCFYRSLYRLSCARGRATCATYGYSKTTLGPISRRACSGAAKGSR